MSEMASNPPSNSFNELLTSLSTSEESSQSLKIFVDIRKNVEWPRNKDNIVKLRETGCLRDIVGALQSPKKGLVDVALSILGNCCLDPRCASDTVSKYGILTSLHQILKHYPSEESINGRVFRIIGNLCQHKWGGVIVDKKPQLIKHTLKFLEDEATNDESATSEATINMGVRALREMMDKHTIEPLVKTFEMLKVVGMVLIKHSTIWNESKKSEGVVINIIKFLLELSRHKYYPSILQLRNTTKGDSIVFLSKILLVAPRQIVKIVMNFLKITHLNSDLPVPEIFNSFIEILRRASIITELDATCEECIKCICHLLEHPANRHNERCGDSIPLLVQVLRDLALDADNKIESSTLIVATLNKCRFNEDLLMKQINCSVVEVLACKVKDMVGDAVPLTVPHKIKKNIFRQYRMKKWLFRPKRLRLDGDIAASSTDDYGDGSDGDDQESCCSNYARFDYSPASSSGSEAAMSWTSGLSPQSSPRSQIYGNSESDSDAYSPVCSDDDGPSSIPICGEGATHNSDDALEPRTSPETDAVTMTHVKIKLVMEIVDLVKTYFKLMVSQLGNPDLLLGLLKCVALFDYSYSGYVDEIVDVVYKLLGLSIYLLPLMQSDFIPAVFDFGARTPHGTWCKKCDQFRRSSSTLLRRLARTAESPVGKGELANKLLRGDSATARQLALVIPYSVRNKSILVALMMNCGGLEILLKLLREDSSPFKEKSIKSLSVMASKKLRIPPPNTSRERTPLPLKKRPLDAESRAIATFKLDDGSLVEADRALLTEKSDFFSRLFNGSFKESSEDVIALSNVLPDSLRFLLFLLECEIDLSVPIEVDVELSTHLDAIALCDRFLMQDYCMFLSDCVEKFRLCTHTVSSIYSWSLESRTNLLRVECVVYALVGNVMDSDRFKMFHHLFEWGCGDELVEDVRNLLVRYMSQNQAQKAKKKKRRQWDDAFF